MPNSNLQIRRMTKREAYEALGLPDVDFKSRPSLALKQLVLTNEVPLDTEMPSIRAFLTAAQQEIDSTPPGGAKKALKRRMITYKSVVSKLRRLPTEILGAIFFFVVQDIEGGFTRIIGGEFRVPVAPWRLGMVCRSWRSAALTFRHLWSSIYLLHPPFSTTRTNYGTLFPIEALNAQLKRSGDAPLDVVVEWSSISPHSRNAYIKLLKAILQHSPRIAKLTIGWLHGEADSGIEACFTPVERRLMQLRHVELSSKDYYVSEGRYSGLKLPWNQITRFRLQICGSSDLKLLRIASETLVDCTLDIWDAYPQVLEDQLEAASSIEFPQLTHLKILLCMDSSGSTVSSAVFLRLLTAPKLTHLSLINASASLVSDFVKRSNCSLTWLRLYIDDNHVTDSLDALDLLAQLPSITHLQVFATIITDQDDWELSADDGGNGSRLSSFIDGLCIQVGGDKTETICPKLESLRIQIIMPDDEFDYDDDEFDDEDDEKDEDVSDNWSLADAKALKEMVDSRTTLKHVTIRCKDDASDAVQSVLKSIQREGMSFRYLQSDWVDGAGEGW